MTTVYILGAGATRGASFINDTSICKPPLDADFYTQLQRIAKPKHQALVKSVAKDAVTLFGTNFHLTLESMFTTLEYTYRMLQTTRDSRDFNKANLQERRNRLMQAIAAIFEESLTEESRLTPRKCNHHQKLVANLQSQDAIISFNYDCLMDHALKEHGNNKWNARYGYGFNLGSKGAKLEGDKFWQPANPASKSETIKFLKLHGSLHFNITKPDKPDPKVHLKQRPYTQQRGKMHFTIIPPEANKRFDHGVFKPLWKQASDVLHRAETIVLIGYSLPSTDLHSTALLRTSIKKESLRSLVVVNPDQEARKRARDILHRGIDSETRVLSFNTLKEFTNAPNSLWKI